MAAAVYKIMYINVLLVLLSEWKWDMLRKMVGLQSEKNALLKALDWITDRNACELEWISEETELMNLTKKFLIWLNNVEDISLVLTFNTRVFRKIQKLITDNSGIVSTAY